MSKPNSLLTNSPLDQFELRNLISIDAPIIGDIGVSLSNIGLYLIISGVIALGVNLLATNYNKILFNN